eukprot:CAMPEP_0201660542 /NCGR_PEP_ID=MMETSP0494-20130426/3174_1 /ASSEMBLY_ACC=CAM_ASM_000839 /TAXON_ID=420259 /ORGANISM="Thalassiosira gravida, Strain GMp14c1" /LENGTH=1055 /DNA_ID=CAMNT_0048138461 /DNA_START=69 /DNA_END=3236 /DNA_ORIENTATION=+
MKLSLSLFTTIALSSPLPSVSQFLSFNAYGTPLEIANNEVEYDQNQNHNGGVSPIISDDHLTLRSTGNRWSAYQLPTEQEVYADSVLQFTFTMTEKTAKGFQAICLDFDLEQTGSDGQCFVLDTSQGWLSSMLNVAKLTPVGGTTHHSIPIGHFMTGPVNYLIFLQDSDDSSNRMIGDSSISDLRLIQENRNKLNIEIDGVAEQLENHQLSYKFKSAAQDTSDWLMEISEDGAGVQVNGNQWKALALNAPYSITHNTVLEFNIVVDDTADFHGICLEDDLDAANGSDQKGCVSFLTPIDNPFYILTTELEPQQPARLVIPLGQIMGLIGGESWDVSYLVFLQDDDKGDKRGSRSTFSDIRIYEEDRMDIKITVFGETVSVPNIQEDFTASSGTSLQDSRDHVMSVSTDGTTVTAYGNSWKQFNLDTPFVVTPSTVLKLTFSMPVEEETGMLCLSHEKNVQRNGRKDCFIFGGNDVQSSSTWFTVMNPLTEEGETTDYEILIGNYFTGPVNFLGFAQDNDSSTRARGESSWSNIEIFTLPSLNIGLDDGSFAIENNQVSYDSTTQDSTPIRDHLMQISPDGSSITVHGNAWRAMPLTTPLLASELGDFVVSFDFVMREVGDFIHICFEDNLEHGDYDDPTDNEYDPKRCFELNDYDPSTNAVAFRSYMPGIGEPHRYVANLSKLFERFNEFKYFAIVADSDAGDKSGGEFTISNIHITTSLTSCLKDVGFSFQVSDCTTENFLAKIGERMVDANCPGAQDPLLELMALFDATQEMEVYKEIEHICKSSYESAEYDFAKTISSETQLVREFIDGGTALNYESDSEGSSLAKDGAGIGFSDEFASTHILTWPKHHALDQCDIGAAMCCWVDSRSDTELVDNTDVCYVNMKSSRRSAHVADGYSIYGDSSEGAVNCHGFAWGTDNGSISSALKGNALFKVGFMDNLFKGLKGNVEQVPGAPMCGCMDRMPVVTKAGCTEVTDSSSVVDVTFNAAIGVFNAKFTVGTIEYNDCGDLKDHYKSLAVEDHNRDFMDSRIVGDGGCHGAINDFLADKGLVKAE